MGVLHADSRKHHLRASVGHVVAIAVGIKKQVRRLADVNSAIADGQRGGEIQSAAEILGLVGLTVAVGVFQDRDSVGAARAAWRWLGYAVVFGAQIAVDL